jgi:hypothetical protein
MLATLVQFVVDRIGDRAFATGGQTGEPQDGSLMPVQLATLFLGDGVCVPGHIGGLLLGH